MAPPVRGQEVPPPTDPPSTEQATDAPSVELEGRIFARMESDGRTDFERELSIPSARIGLKARLRFADAEISADAAGSSILRDAYVRLRDGEGRLRLQGGRFKAPFTARSLESSWKLPLVSRGITHEYLVDDHQLGGRRLGLMAETKLRRVKASVGLFEGAVDPRGERDGEDVSARVEVEPTKTLELGATAYLARAIEPKNGMGGAARRSFGGDATLTLGAARLVIEGQAGRLPLGAFTAASALAFYEHPLGTEGAWVLQPVLAAEVLVVRLSEGGAGRGWAATAGVNVLYLERVRVQLQLERALAPGDAAQNDRLVLQLGAKF